MKKKAHYITPSFALIEVTIEAGFAVSPSGDFTGETPNFDEE